MQFNKFGGIWKKNAGSVSFDIMIYSDQHFNGNYFFVKRTATQFKSTIWLMYSILFFFASS